MDDFLTMIIFDPAYIYSHKDKDPNNFWLFENLQGNMQFVTNALGSNVS